MAVASFVVTFESPLSKGALNLATQFQAWLAAHPSIIVRDVVTFGFNSVYSSEVNRHQLSYKQFCRHFLLLFFPFL